MAKIKFVNSKERNFVSSRERAKTDSYLAAALEHLPPSERNGASFIHHEGSSDQPQLFEVKLPPNYRSNRMLMMPTRSSS